MCLTGPKEATPRNNNNNNNNNKILFIDFSHEGSCETSCFSVYLTLNIAMCQI